MYNIKVYLGESLGELKHSLKYFCYILESIVMGLLEFSQSHFFVIMDMYPRSEILGNYVFFHSSRNIIFEHIFKDIYHGA